MEKRTLLALALLVCILLTACGGGSPKNDEGFLTNLAVGLDARLDLVKSEDYAKSHSFVEATTGYINAELDALGKYEDYTFTDERLADLAKQYFDALASQLTAMDYASTDGIAYREYYELKGYDVRVKVLAQLEADYGFSVDNTHTVDFDEMTADGEMLLTLEELAAQQTPIRILTGGSMNDYIGKLVNTTELDLSGSYINIYPMDKKGKAFDTYGGAAESWKPGESVDVRFIGVQSLIPTTMGLSIELPSELKTDYMLIDFEEGGIDFVLKDAPCELGDHEIFRIDSVTASAPTWIDGKAALHLWFNGEKTYDSFMSMLQDYIDHPENYTQEEASKYTLDTMPANLYMFLQFSMSCRSKGLDPSCASDIINNPENYYDAMSGYTFFSPSSFAVEIYNSDGELVAEDSVTYGSYGDGHKYTVGEKLTGADNEQIYINDLAPDTYTVVIK